MLVVLVSAVALLAAGCADDESTDGADPTTTESSGPTTSAGDATTTTPPSLDAEGPFIEDLQFHNMEVGAREVVTVENRDDVPHTFSFAEESVAISLGGGESGSFTAPDAGEYEIFCEIHGSMTATLVVS
jgi:plastocyanin